MWKLGDIISIRFCDRAENQGIFNRPLFVTAPSSEMAPCWTEVECEGARYTVRGTEARRV